MATDRLEVFQRDNWACTACGHAKTTLHVHHKSCEFGQDPSQYPLSNLTTLSEKCHDKKSDGRYAAEKRPLSGLINARSLVRDLDTFKEDVIARKAGDLRRALLDFLDTFTLVFDMDWEFT
jgi:5-methylcytosine-specific restriction endonuclease McrA